ncbi:MAG: glycosyltransferase family 39 protein [Thermoleophilaceae bacterium]|nr:glycosyltransferase family 39 protein [Thermoleophilaceae bacterium]
MTRGLALILAVALLARVGLVIATPDFVPRGDPAEYDTIATSVAAGDGYPDISYATPNDPSALRPPGYPFALGAVYAVSGDSRDAGRIFGALLGVLSVALIFLIARATLGEREARIAGWFAALFPPLVVLNASLLSEALFMPLMLGAIFATLRFRAEPGRVGWALAAGALIGAAALTRSAGLLLAIPVGIALITAERAPWPAEWTPVHTRRRWGRLIAPAVALAAMILVIAPWTIRNAAELDAFVPIATQDGYTYAGEYNELADRRGDALLDAVWQNPPSAASLRPLFAEGLTEPELNSKLRGRAFTYMGDHPGYVARALTFNSLRMVHLGSDNHTTEVYNVEANVPEGLRRVSQLSVYLALLLAIAGAVVLIRRREGPLWLWLGVPVAMWIAVAPVLGTPRYRSPLDPFLVMFAAVAVAALLSRRDRRA